jgi:uncharacterized protein YaeQ
MPTHPERREFRLMFSNVDIGATVEKVLVISRHPAESAGHLTLRVLAFALLYEERLEMGLGIDLTDEPDLLAHDLTGKVSTWIACGDITADRARWLLQHNRDARVHVVFGTRARRERFLAEVEDLGGVKPRGWSRLSLWTIDEGLVDCLAQLEGLRQRWTLTIVGDHIYAEADGVVCDGPVTRG